MPTADLLSIVSVFQSGFFFLLVEVGGGGGGGHDVYCKKKWGERERKRGGLGQAWGARN